MEFKEEIGRGAFGKVLRGIFREAPGIEVFYKSRTHSVDFQEGRTVAVKKLGGKWLSLSHKDDYTKKWKYFGANVIF